MERLSERFGRVGAAVEAVRLIDTHEHLPQEEERLKDRVDALATFLPHYASSDLVSAGLSQEDLAFIRDSALRLEERWDRFEPFWERMENTGYGRALSLAVRGLYGLDGLSRETVETLSARMREANKPGLYKHVLKEKAGIDLSILDTETVQVDRAFFAPVMRFDGFITVKERWELELIKRRVGFPIHTLDDLLRALGTEFERLGPRIVGVKLPLAYRRSLEFEKATYAEAEAVFNRICRQRVFKRVEMQGVRRTLPEALSFEETKPLQDFLVHRLLNLASTHRLPVQVHTGLQEGNENLITNSNPVLLTNLFMEYSEVSFDVFHGSYPYSGELTALTKNFPNVYADMCWLHVISPFAARNILSEWLDALPISKILAFGGDYRFVEGAYAHAEMARENVARALWAKLEEGAFTERQVIKYAEMLLRTNAQALFCLLA